MNNKFFVRNLLKFFILITMATSIALSGCQSVNQNNKEDTTDKTDSARATDAKGSFKYDVDFISQHHDVIVLKEGKAQLITLPYLQGRVLTSSYDGEKGPSLGYINHDRIASDSIQPHIQAYGGEDRFWIGPQGGQYTVYFKPGDPFDFDHWFTPAPFDTEPFELVSKTEKEVVYKKKMQLMNYSKTVFDFDVNRKVKMLSPGEASKLLGVNELDKEIKFVGFESDNEIRNTGKESWVKEKGLLSIWILGMFPPSDHTTVVIPFRGSLSNKRAGITEYFTNILGTLPGSRLKADDKAVYYKADGNYCSKIGITQQHATPVFGSYDAERNVLTIIQYSLPEQPADYVNSSWEVQKEPYKGDVINSYNDGSLDHIPAKSTFYELESSSPAVALKPNEKLQHIHRTFHFSGDTAKLNELAKSVLGITLQEASKAFD